MSESRIIVETLSSSSLKHNPLGDPFTRPVTTYLPPGYDEGLDRYPVVYLLAGFSGSGLSFLNREPWEENIKERMDRLIDERQCRPMIVVLPDCFTRYGGSQYIDSSAIGNYGSYLLEIVDFIDNTFRTIANRDYRAIAGKSSGGYGALMNAMHHPGVFGSVVDHSGDKFFEKCYASELLELPDLLSRMDAKAILDNPWGVRSKDHSFFQLMSIAAMAACYSPNPDSKLGFDWPVDSHTGELIHEVWMRWKAMDPVEILEFHLDALRSLKLLYFDCGNRDEYHIHLGCRLMHRRLESLGIEHTYEEFDGGHRHTLFRYDRSFPILSAAFSP
jgi:S-formylglutathione hydrolase FrmB